jgi:hypothetical protein
MTEHVESVDVETTDVGDGAEDSPTSRRRLFQIGLAGAAAVAGAAALDGLTSTPAGAATGGPLLIGDVNAPTLTTDVTTLNGQFAASTTLAQAGVHGNTTGGGTGVLGTSNDGSGVGYGVKGTITAGTGVYGSSGASGTYTSVGVEGVGNTGVIGTSNATSSQGGAGVVGNGVFALPGVKGIGSATGTGVLGTASGSGTGVEGTTGTGIGVLGSSTDATGAGYGVKGTITYGTGVYGSSGPNSTYTSVGVQGVGSTGVLGVANGTTSTSTAGVAGTGVGVAPGLQGTNTSGPALQLYPYGSTTLPGGDTGSLIVLSNGKLYYAYADGDWAPLSGVVPLPAPVRIVDTTSSGGSVGGIAGPLAPSSGARLTSVLTGAHGIPSQATALVGNFAISGVGGALLNGYGVATIFPAGVATPATANINAGAGCFAISNTVTVALGTGADLGKLAIVWDGGGPVPNAQAFFDVTAYIL